MTYSNWNNIESKIREKLTLDSAHPLLAETFLKNVRAVYDGNTGLIKESDINPADNLPDYVDLAKPDETECRQILKNSVMIKLNGGLGTSMGLEKAKSLLPVKNGLTFIDIIARQILYLRNRYQADMPLLFMTSFNTDCDTKTALQQYPELAAGQNNLPFTFLQNRVPKLHSDTLHPATWNNDPNLEWCPPGHGDIYTALMTSGLLEQLVKDGYRYAFVSNSDNLGAVMDPAISCMMQSQNIPFLLEVADRTEADRKGGHLATSIRTGQLILRESAQCPPDAVGQFQDVKRHRYFNTNNLWIDLTVLNALIRETGSAPELAPMINRKTLDPRNGASPSVIQLETAMGAAVTSFKKAVALRVPRTRFAPVKTTDDLLGLWSDAYVLTEEMHIRLDSRRAEWGPPVIRLDPAYYRKIDDFSARFPHGAPSLVECRSLTVKGDHSFPGGLVLKGDVVYE